MRLIDADALIEFCAERWIPLNIDAVNMQPTIQPEKAQLSQQGTTSDLISRQEVINAIENTNAKMSMPEWDEITNAVMSLPTIQPEPQKGHWTPKEGYWIKYDERFPWRHIYKCSKCGNYLDFSGVNGSRGGVNFCPNCGAKMTISTK